MGASRACGPRATKMYPSVLMLHRPVRLPPRKLALWKAVHHARLLGVSLKGITRDLGIFRNTVSKYLDLPASPVSRTARRAVYLTYQDKSIGLCLEHLIGYFRWTST